MPLWERSALDPEHSSKGYLSSEETPLSLEGTGRPGRAGGCQQRDTERSAGTLPENSAAVVVAEPH